MPLLAPLVSIDTWLPPASLPLLALVALLCLRRAARPLATAALLLLALLSLSAVSQPLLAALDVPEPPLPTAPLPPGAPGAIVILSADVQRTAIPGLPAIGPMTLERERAGAALARRTGLPILVTGGLVTAPPAVANLMAASMAADFGVPVRWAENASLTTWENATLSVPILRAAGITHVYLVTHAWHMRRSLLAFRRAGMPATPASVLPDPWPAASIFELLPRASSWERSYLAFHEWTGLLWYHLRPAPTLAPTP